MVHVLYNGQDELFWILWEDSCRYLKWVNNLNFKQYKVHESIVNEQAS